VERKQSGSRNGTINSKEVVFSVSVTLNNGHVCGAEGHIEKPEELYDSLGGTTATLTDTATGNAYLIFVVPKRFNFMVGYEKANELI